MGKVFVDNNNMEHTRECRSADGLSIQVQPGAKNVPIDEKFTWSLPGDVTRSRSKVRVFESAEELKARQDAEKKAREAEQKENQALIDAAEKAEKAESKTDAPPPNSKEKQVEPPKVSI